MKALITVKDEVYCTVTGLSKEHINFLDDKFAVMKDGARYMMAYKIGKWDGKIRFFNRITGQIYLRLLDQVVPFLENWGYDIDIDDQRQYVSPVETRIDKDWFVNKNCEVKIELRPYQVEAINKALDETCGFVISCTGSGKTWMLAGLADILASNDKRSLIMVPSADLVTQTVASFRMGKLDVGVYSGDEKDINHSVVVATWQALQNNPKLMQEFDAVMVDEAHGATAQVIGELINVHGKNIAYRWGFTGTLPKPKLDQMTLAGCIGQVLMTITAKQLIDLGYLAQIDIEPVEITEDVEEEFPDYSSEKAYLSKNPKRLDLLADLIIARCAKYGNTLVLVNSIKQGQQLQKLIKDSVFLYGTTENEVRAEWYSMFENHDDLIVIATFGIASTGISIDRVFALFMVDAGKSFIRCIQSIGRGLRLGHDKFAVHVTDVYSKLKWSKKHFSDRKKYYNEACYPISKPVKIRS